jgi:FdrA protein
MKAFPESNLVLFSIPGPFVKREAKNALLAGKNVMIFSDNVTIEEEKELKELAREKGLIVMGPDCGTAIINGKGLAFANSIPAGRIAVIGASGTGIQEVTSIICNRGHGIKHAIGLGGRDLSKNIGGISMLTALDAVENDSDIELVVLVSKPPCPEVEEKILDRIKNYKKKVIVNFLKGNEKKCAELGIPFAATLEEAANLAVSVIENKKTDVREFYYDSDKITEIIKKIKAKMSGKKYLRGLYSGGTLCDESLYILENSGIDVYSNIPLKPENRLENSWKSQKNTLVDLGEDEFTKGRPHPMIDYSLRCSRIIEEAGDPETGIILLDIVTGYGSHPNPAEPLSEAIKEALEINKNLSFVAYICGTKGDPQNIENIKKELEKLGVIFMPTNAQAAKLCAICIK